MSSVYIQEPPTSGKVLLKTNFGDIDIELWSKEAPLACRNFIQLCMEGYYNHTIFHRVIKGFIAQGGDPEDGGLGGKSIYGRPFKNEIHSRLRFNRRGLLGMANVEHNCNQSQFFFTLGPAPELDGKNTVFGKVCGETLYNMLKLDEVDVNENDKPLSDYKIIKAEILKNPFTDIVPRVTLPKNKKPIAKVTAVQAVKNFNLLSFGDEAEEDELESINECKKYLGKGKSTHDLLNDPTLSKVPAVDLKSENADDLNDAENMVGDVSSLEQIKKKLKTGEKSMEKRGVKVPDEDKFEIGEESELQVSKLDSKNIKELKRQVKELKRSLKAEDKKLKNNEEKRHEGSEDVGDKSAHEKDEDDNGINSFKRTAEMYKNLKKQLPTGAQRDNFTASTLKKFMTSLRQKIEINEEDSIDEENDDESLEDDSWMRHKLVAKEDTPNDRMDEFAIFDPRNPIQKRRRKKPENTNKKTHKASNSS